MATPRRLRITIEVNIDTLDSRQLRNERRQEASNAAIDAAVSVLRDRLEDDSFTLHIGTRTEFMYQWQDTVVGLPLAAPNDGVSDHG